VRIGKFIPWAALVGASQNEHTGDAEPEPDSHDRSGGDVWNGEEERVEECPSTL
jgi:hypothetical protein